MTYERKQQYRQPLAGLLLMAATYSTTAGGMAMVRYMCSDGKAMWGGEESDTGQFGGYRVTKLMFSASWITGGLAAWYQELALPSWWVFIHSLCQIPTITHCENCYPILPTGRPCLNKAEWYSAGKLTDKK